MHYWNLLEIQPTSDKRLIKRAYAKKLKQCRPDQDPKAFQSLYEAYQSALNHLEEASESSFDEAFLEENSVPDQSFAEKEIKKNAFEAITHYENKKINFRDDSQDRTGSVDPEENLKNEWETIDPYEAAENVLATCREILQDPQRYDEIQSWTFLQGHEDLFDRTCKEYVARNLLNLLIEKKESKEKATQFYVSEEVLTFLNQIFWWTDRLEDYEDEYSIEHLEKLFTYFFKQQGKEYKKKLRVQKWSHSPNFHQEISQQQLYFWRRLVALALDLSMGLCVSAVIFQLLRLTGSTGIMGSDSFYIVGIVLGLVMISFFEGSTLQASPGKLAMGIRVVCLNSQPLSYLKSFWRCALFIAFFVGIFLSITNSYVNSVSTYIILVSVYILSDKKRPGHDLFSKTCVIRNLR